MTKKELIAKLSTFDDDTIVVIKDSFQHLSMPSIGYTVIGDNHLSKFPWYLKDDERKELLGKTVITIS